MSTSSFILITNEGTLTLNQRLIPPYKRNEFYFLYALRTTNQLIVRFESREKFEENFLITTFPFNETNFENEFLLGLPDQDQVLSIELAKKFVFHIELPFTVTWQSKSHVRGFIVKSFIANLPDSISEIKIKPQGKLKEKNNLEKDSIPIVIQVNTGKPNGIYSGSISYNFTPKNWLLNKQWGSKSDLNQKLLQRYTGEQKYWRFPKVFEDIISRYTSITDIYTVAKEIFTLARNTITVEYLDYRKGVLNLLHEMRGDCDEFTDLMITLLRRLKFPVRRVDGMVFDLLTNEISHHTWPEIFSPACNNWIPIDAAMNFFGFQSLSIIPLKIEGTTVISNTLEVTFLDPTQKVDIEVKLLDTIISTNFLNSAD